jgi:hypothetical protein
MSLHRLELKLNPKLHIGLSESVIFGGRDNSPQLKYISPSSVFFLSKMNDRKNDLEGSANALMSIDILFKPTKKMTFYAQGLIDDIDFTKFLRSVYPDRLGILAKVIVSDPIPASQLSMTYAKISNWTYNSFYTWGNYTYYGKSLGYPQHGLEKLELTFNYFGMSSFMLNGRLGFEQYRRQALMAPFIAKKTAFPIGIPTKNIFFGGGFQWFPSRHLLFGTDFKLNRIENENHVFSNIVYQAQGDFSVKIFGFFDFIDKK